MFNHSSENHNSYISNSLCQKNKLFICEFIYSKGNVVMLMINKTIIKEWLIFCISITSLKSSCKKY